MSSRSYLKRRDDEIVPSCPLASTKTVVPVPPVVRAEMPRIKARVWLLPIRMVEFSAAADVNVVMIVIGAPHIAGGESDGDIAIAVVV
jgi:hypothetical protein